MAENSRGMLFRKRNVLGAALVAGIGLGIYFGQWKGFGLGGGSSSGLGTSAGETQASLGTGEIINETTEFTKDDVQIPVPEVVRVLIDEEQFLLRQANDGTKDVPITLSKLIQLIERAPGDRDGLRVRIYERLTARASAEEELKKALVAAGIQDSAVFWVPPSQQVK